MSETITLKPFTEYICSTGNVGLGHSGHYTGAYKQPSPHDGFCICGAPMMENLPDGFNYRLEFETVDPHYAAETEWKHGKLIWSQFSDYEWEHLPWRQITKEESTKPHINQQYQNLLESAKSHRQPIRNVRLLKSVQGEWQPTN